MPQRGDRPGWQNVVVRAGSCFRRRYLSLALALSDNIQHLTKSKQTLFWTKASGSLDKESLQTVFKTLQALRNGEPDCGKISHVRGTSTWSRPSSAPVHSFPVAASQSWGAK
jgi:hypothetical protein